MATVEKATATEYVVLEERTLSDGTGDLVAYVEVGTASATTRQGAVAQVAKDREAVWRAVPARNWAEAIRTRKETTVKIKVEPVEPF
jgi:hypothetical protein